MGLTSFQTIYARRNYPIREGDRNLKKLLAALGMALLLLLGTSLTTSAASNVYTVKSGDTLYKISQQTKVSVNNLKSWNGLKSNLIYPKQQLKLKKTTAQTISKPSTSSSTDKVV